MQGALALRKDGLPYETLADKDREHADTGARHIKVAGAILGLRAMCKAS